ncbi:MAG: UDP-N-acetylmuramate--L-alanine ligase [Rikenellaceae bacterium]|nr:UDP-N-acetylmuramate--L-alanine ligase [Rikenellaceae bacterium]
MAARRLYFLGIGGIGMSALARFFMHEGCQVAGYDRTATPLTARLEAEGAQVNYQDSVEAIPEQFLDKSTVVVYTPAVPADHPQMQYFREGGYRMLKRSQMLGELSVGKFVMAVAGTHGKTTTSTLVSWLNYAAAGEGSAFLGGVSKNFDSNLVLGTGRRLAVEADEFDRSFLQLTPNVAVVTSADADHLDIYGTHEAVKEAFSQFIDRISAGGALVIKRGVDVAIRNGEISVYRYSFDEPSDFYATNITLLPTGHYTFDIVTPFGTVEGCTLGIPGWVNVENAVAAVALFILAAKSEGKDVDYDALRRALAEFSGVKRRFEFYVNTPKAVYMDDYAHHPRELMAAITSVKRMFPGRKLTALFQPHLYTRTRDLYEEFAQALSLADEVVLLPIYPARELPIEGITSQIIADRVAVPCAIVEREGLAQWLADADTDIVVTFGAGNIDAYCTAVAEVIEAKSR